MYKIIITLLLVFTLQTAWATTIPYGKSGKIIYHLDNGSFDVFEGNTMILSGAFSSASTLGERLVSKEYQQKYYSRKPVNDHFGKGYQHTFLLTAKGKPAMRQVFYVYEHLTYFMLQVGLEGGKIQTNDMVPIDGTVLPGKQSGTLRTLFTPFDNDTFISYESKRMAPNDQLVSAETGTWYDDTSRWGIVTGSVEHELWKTGVQSTVDLQNNLNIKVLAGYTAQKLNRDDMPHGIISGTVVKSPKIFFGVFTDWRKGMELYAEANKMAEPPFLPKWNKATPVGWNSWGAMQEKITLDKAKVVADFFADSLQQFRSGNTAYIDLDSYWDKLLKGGLEGDYSQLKAFADHVKSKGLKPGAYWAPFTDWGFGSGGNRRVEGSNYTYGEIWTKTASGYHDLDGTRALDPTHPGTQKRIKLVISKLKECGFEMIKIDFLGHAAIESSRFYDPKVATGMQAYKVGMEYLLKQLDGKMLIYAAISPNLATARYVHMRRIACDAFKSVHDTKYTLNSLTYGWWLTHLYDYMDADHIVLADESLGANTARTLSGIITGTFITGDDFSVQGPWKERARTLFQNPTLLNLIHDGKAFTPVNHSTDKGASGQFIKWIGNDLYLAIFNYEDHAQPAEINLSRLGLQENAAYQISDVLNPKSSPLKKGDTIQLGAGDAQMLLIQKK